MFRFSRLFGISYYLESGVLKGEEERLDINLVRVLIVWRNCLRINTDLFLFRVSYVNLNSF